VVVMVACGLALAVRAEVVHSQCIADEFQNVLTDDAAAGGQLGFAVSIDGDVVIVEAVADDNKNRLRCRLVYFFMGVGNCNDNGAATICDVADGTSRDCNVNEVPDECDIADGSSMNANENGIPDEGEFCTGNERIKSARCEQQNNGKNELTI